MVCTLKEEKPLRLPSEFLSVGDATRGLVPMLMDAQP